jgi:hypothetical protein
MTHLLKFAGTPLTFTAGLPFLSAHRSPSTTYPSPCLAAKWSPHVSHHILFFFLSVSSPRDVAAMETGGGRELAPTPWLPLAVLWCRAMLATPLGIATCRPSLDLQTLAGHL